MSAYPEGFEDKLNITKELYDKCYNETKDEKNNKKLNMINIEVKRTLTPEFINANPTFASSLEEVLKTFIISTDRQEYKSGMSFIGKMVLNSVNNNKFNAFVILKNIFEDKNIKEIYDNNLQNIENKFKIICKEKRPILYQYFEKNKIDLIFLTYWLMTLLSFNFDEKISEYVFKIFLKKKDFDVYIKAVLSILIVLENEILSKNNMDVYILLNSTKIINVDFDKFVENINKLGL